MKLSTLFLPLSFLITTLSGCAYSPFISNYITSKKYVVISSVDKCTFISKVKSPVSANSKKVDDAPLWAISYLKKFANLRVKGGNALAEIRMTEREFPTGEANVYQCPQDIFDKYKTLQDDKEFLYSNIKFDLPKPKTVEEEKE